MGLRGGASVWGFGLLRLLLAAALVGLHHRIHRRFLHLQVVEEHAGALLAVGGTPVGLGLEVHARTYDVLCSRELLGALCGLRLQSHLERAETVELHAIALAQPDGHDLHQLVEHGQHVRLLHRDVRLDHLSNLLRVEHAADDGAGIPHALVLRFLAVVLIQLVLNCHSLFSFH